MVFKRKFFKKQKYIKEQFPKDDDEIKALNDERKCVVIVFGSIEADVD